MKKRSIVLILIFIILVSTIYIVVINKKSDNADTFYLDSEYYGNGKLIDTNSTNVQNLLDEKSNFLLFVYNNYCNLPVSSESIFKSVSKKNNIDILQITFEDFKNTSLYDYVKFAPSIIIIKNGKIVDYLKSDSDEDLDKYQNEKNFKNWIKNYVELEDIR